MNPNEIPSHLACPFCPSQAFPKVQTRPKLIRYQCVSKHTFFILEDDPLFNRKPEQEREN